MLHLASTTSAAWLPHALSHMDDVLVDHAHCEHKAAASALMLVGRYPGDAALVVALSRLAAEEAVHLARVAAICAERGLTLPHPAADPYAQGLLAPLRKSGLEGKVDRLLACGLIEARSCERLKLLSLGLAPKPGEERGDSAFLACFYDELWRDEARHHTLFFDLAQGACRREGVGAADAAALIAARAGELARLEAELVASLPLRAAIH